MFFLILFLFFSFALLHPKGVWHASTVLFVAMIITGDTVPESGQFLGFLDHRTISSLMVIGTALLFKRSVYRFRYKNLDRNKRSAIVLLVVFLVLMHRYLEVKEAIFMGGEFENFTFIKRLLRDSIYGYSAYLVIKGMGMEEKTHLAIQEGLFVGLLFVVPSLFFPGLYETFGFVLDQRRAAGATTRLTGVLMRNANTAAGIFVVAYGYFLANAIRKGKFSRRDIATALMIFLGVLNFGSKTGFVVFGALTLLYFWRTARNVRQFFKSAILISLLFIPAFTSFGELISQRFEDQISGKDDTLGFAPGLLGGIYPRFT